VSDKVDRAVPVATLLSDRVLDGVLGFLLVRATVDGGDNSVQNLARWDLKAALVEVLGREGIRA
jgi:hypothetical protein